jgi:uncharacterized membrane-anchored protein YitT (DUF2179 family)
MFNKDITYSVFWNCFLIVSGSAIFAIGLKGIAEPHQFIAGGLYGIALTIYYLTNFMEPALLFAILNIPILIAGHIYLSRRFVLYSLLSMATSTIVYSAFSLKFPIDNQLYAAVACGVVTGFGSGIVLRSLGSGGGLDVIGVILFQKFNIGLGKFFFFFNFILFTFCFFMFATDLVVVSMIMVFVASLSLDYSLSLFNQRKMVFIITEKAAVIADDIIENLKISTTMIDGVGAFSKSSKQILMTVINNIQLKRLEEIVFTTDEYALFIVENTFNVIGSGFSKRKIY